MPRTSFNGNYITNTHTGTTSTNVGLYASASGGTTANYAAIFNAGNVGIGTSAPARKLELYGALEDTANNFFENTQLKRSTFGSSQPSKGLLSVQKSVVF